MKNVRGDSMKIAITGTIGSGKSTAVSYIKSKGFEVFDCDDYSHQLLKQEAVITQITNEFDCLENGEISRKKLGNIVFNDEEALEKLNAIIHPLVKQAILELKPPIFIDIPLLFEANMESLFDVIITVCASKDVIVERLMKRDSMSIEQAQRRISLQIDEKIKKKNSNYVIMNNDTHTKLYEQIDVILGGLEC